MNEVINDNLKLHKQVNELQIKVQSLELQSRRNNLIFCGIAAKDQESWADCEKIISDLLVKAGVCQF